MDWSPLWISLYSGGIATLLTFVLGNWAAYGVYRMKRLQGVVDVLFTLPLVLPPTVVGFFLLVIFGKNSPVGQLLSDFGVSMVFSRAATVLAATVVSFPLMYRTARGAFEQLDMNMIYAARTLGMPERRIFTRVIFPTAWPGILGGTVLSFARAIGEFGATIMIAGNIRGRTQTISVAIYSAMQSGDRTLAYRWVFVIVGMSFLVIIAMNYWTALQKKWMVRRLETEGGE